MPGSCLRRHRLAEASPAGVRQRDAETLACAGALSYDGSTPPNGFAPALQSAAGHMAPSQSRRHRHSYMDAPLLGGSLKHPAGVLQACRPQKTPGSKDAAAVRWVKAAPPAAWLINTQQGIVAGRANRAQTIRQAWQLVFCGPENYQPPVDT